MFIKKPDRVILSEINKLEIVNPFSEICYSLIELNSQIKIFSETGYISPNRRDWYEDLIIDMTYEDFSEFDFYVKVKLSKETGLAASGPVGFPRVTIFVEE